MVLQSARRSAQRAVRSLRRWRGTRSVDVRPPRIGPGERTGPPDFIGVGAQKAGTSWWFSLLSEHPGVHTPDGVPKEYHYFDRFFDRPLTDEDVTAYHRLFPRPPGTITGEWTPGYLSDFWVPRALRRAAPDARLLVLLRDPVERYRSGITHTAGTSRGPLLRAAAIGAYQRGLYADQLEWLFACFSRDRVLVLQYERCRAAPSDELRRTFEFLGLDAAVAPPPRPDRRVNETVSAKVPLPEEVRAALVEAYRPQVPRLAELVPTLDLSLWPDFAPGATTGRH